MKKTVIKRRKRVPAVPPSRQSPTNGTAPEADSPATDPATILPQTATATGSASFPTPTPTSADTDQNPSDLSRSLLNPSSRPTSSATNSNFPGTPPLQHRITPVQSPTASTLADRLALRGHTRTPDSANMSTKAAVPLTLPSTGAGASARKQPWWIDDRSTRESELQREAREREARERSLRETHRLATEREREAREKEAKDRQGVSGFPSLLLWLSPCSTLFRFLSRRTFPISTRINRMRRSLLITTSFVDAVSFVAITQPHNLHLTVIPVPHPLPCRRHYLCHRGTSHLHKCQLLLPNVQR